MLLTSTGAISRSQHQEESALLLRKIEELNKNTARLIAEAVKINSRIETAIGTGQVSRNPSTKLKWHPSTHY
jgi:hypothetical protein